MTISTITTIGIDLAKQVFQIHGVDERGTVVLRKRLRRRRLLPFFANLAPCLIGMEACGGAHHWARELIALGHRVKLMPPSYVKPYVKRGKNDAVDAAACCEAVERPSMRFVAIKSPEQQSVLQLHRARDLLTGIRTKQVNALRSHLAEFGIVRPRGVAQVKRLIADAAEAEIPPLTRIVIEVLAAQLQGLQDGIDALEAEIMAWHKNNPASRRLATIPGIGPITATALVASIGDASAFRSGRELAAWLGLVPKEHSTGGKIRLGGISKQGNRYLRRLLVLGATSALRRAPHQNSGRAKWVCSLAERKPARLVTVALANKMARIAWAILTRQETYQPNIARAA